MQVLTIFDILYLDEIVRDFFPILKYMVEKLSFRSLQEKYGLAFISRNDIQLNWIFYVVLQGLRKFLKVNHRVDVHNRDLNLWKEWIYLLLSLALYFGISTVLTLCELYFELSKNFANVTSLYLDLTKLVRVKA